MNKDEALKMAIEALQNNQVYDCEGKPMLAIEEANEKAIQACKEALEQPAPSWQGLSDDEIRLAIRKATDINLIDIKSIEIYVARAIE